MTRRQQNPGADAGLAAYIESIELTLVVAYERFLPVLPEEARQMAEQFAGHHRDHAGAFAGLALGQATGRANAALLASLEPTLAAIADGAAAFEVAAVLEHQIAATYGHALTVFSEPAAARAATTVLPVETAHATMLGHALGKAPEQLFAGALISLSLGSGEPNRGFDPNAFPLVP